jgi:hypothetical protein
LTFAAEAGTESPRAAAHDVIAGGSREFVWRYTYVEFVQVCSAFRGNRRGLQTFAASITTPSLDAALKLWRIELRFPRAIA